MAALSYDDVLTRNLALIQRACGKTVSESSRFVDDLELDSIDLVGLIAEMEEEFAVFVPEERLRTFQTVGEATRCIHELLTSGEQVA